MLDLLICPFAVLAQDAVNEQAPAPVREQPQDVVKEWSQEISLDTIDQEKLPKKVTGGVMLMGNLSNFIINNSGGRVSSYMKFGVDFGGLLNFHVVNHFAMETRVIITAEENYVSGVNYKQQLWSIGMDIPVYFMGQFGNMRKGYLRFGAGPFTHFTFASNVNAYNNNAAPTAQSPAVHSMPASTTEEPSEYQTIYSLHDNHSGLAATISYEFALGIQIVLNYQISLTDIITYYKDNPNSDLSIYPQRLSLGLAYRWK